MNSTPAVFLRLSSFLAVVLAISVAGRAEDWAPNLTMTGTWHSNATNADDSEDQLESLQLSADVLAARSYELSRDDTLQLSGHLAGEWWPRYDTLLRGAAGVRGELEHRFGPDPRAPVIAIEGAVDEHEARESGRRGTGTRVGASVRKRLNDLTRATLSHEVAWHNARLETYDAAASETSFDLEYDLTAEMRLTFTARYRDGDIISYASGLRPDLEARAPHRLELETFDRPMTAYRIDAQTWSGRLSLIRAVDDSTAILVAYERRESRRGPLRFPDHLLSVAMVHQF